MSVSYKYIYICTARYKDVMPVSFDKNCLQLSFKYIHAVNPTPVSMITEFSMLINI